MFNDALHGDAQEMINEILFAICMEIFYFVNEYVNYWNVRYIPANRSDSFNKWL